MKETRTGLRTQLIVGGILLAGIAALFIFKPSPASHEASIGTVQEPEGGATAGAPKPMLPAGLAL
ncbi:MAG: hypothetical protein QF600_08690, partial [Verrucomicrobiota bacterium]|nr:hypothetical protein [Verrucomicrobiota bacterium]